MEGLSVEGWAVIGGVLIAAMSFASQALSQARTARLALFEQRLEVVRAVFRLLFEAGRVAQNRYLYKLASQNGRLAEEKERLDEAISRAGMLNPNASYLFGGDYYREYRSAIVLAGEIRRAALDLLASDIDLLED